MIQSTSPLSALVLSTDIHASTTSARMLDHTASQSAKLIAQYWHGSYAGEKDSILLSMARTPPTSWTWRQTPHYLAIPTSCWD
jgi:hypothetical protein